jgi:1-hydroxycarotenoid 3,4-desaturase
MTANHLAPITVVGAGVGGLVAAIRLAARGHKVRLLDSGEAPGGKLRPAAVGGKLLDAGPTVLTMRSVFDEVFAEAGHSLERFLRLKPLRVLGRHLWGPEEKLDLYTDVAASADAVGSFAGAAEAMRFRSFMAQARRTLDALEGSYLRQQRPHLPQLVHRIARRSPAGLLQLHPFTSLWNALGRHFRDPRLQQLFGRYSTYCGSSPFQAPATLMLIAQVEADGVWDVEGGVFQIGIALGRLATALGVDCRQATTVRRITLRHGRVSGVQLDDGEWLASSAVVFNGDSDALAQGLLGEELRRTAPQRGLRRRSLSALTFNLLATTSGLPLTRHAVFFSRDYRREFDEILRDRRLPSQPTIYVCAQDRDDTGLQRPGEPERLFCLVNAPPTGDGPDLTAAEIDSCTTNLFATLAHCGLQLQELRHPLQLTTPAQFHRRFPGTGGALYGAATHGWQASFRRQGSRTVIPGLYLAGGSVHPGPGLPMAALSGRLASESLMADLASTARLRPMATPGGISMR